MKFKLIIAFLGVALVGCVAAGTGRYFVEMISGHITELVGTAAPLVNNARTLTRCLHQVQLLGIRVLELDSADKIKELAHNMDQYDAEFGRTLARIEELAKKKEFTFKLVSQQAIRTDSSPESLKEKNPSTRNTQAVSVVQLAKEKQVEFTSLTRQIVDARLRVLKDRASSAKTFHEYRMQMAVLYSLLRGVVTKYEQKFAANAETVKTRVQGGVASVEELNAIVTSFYEKDYPVVSGINTLAAYLMNTRDNVRTYLTEKNPKKLQEIRKVNKQKVLDTTSLLDSIAQRASSKEIKEGLEQSAADLKKLNELVLGEEGILAAHRRAVEAEEFLGLMRKKLAEASEVCQVAIDGIAQESDKINSKFLAQTGEVASFARRWDWAFLAIAGSGLIISILLGAIFATTLSRPLIRLAEQAGVISKGDLKVEIEAQDRRDELGVLTNAFRLMLENLRHQIRRTMEGVHVLSTSASQISQTVSGFASNISQATTALAETSTTAEQVRQAATLSNEKAKSVAEDSQKAVETSHSGLRATDVTVKQMRMVKEQMETISGTVVQLSEQSQAIEGIIESVQDLANQSNLLAVNASIEAARAAEHGKGFGVVAHEIKTLADQSKDATSQIGEILQDTRRLIAAVVMATEQGNKSVDAGVQQSILAGESIQVLAGNVEDSAQAASVIEASTLQQLTGVEELSKAVISIEQAMKQNLEGSGQLKRAGEELGALAGQLDELGGRFRV